jgi:hypothetical protein
MDPYTLMDILNIDPTIIEICFPTPLNYEQSFNEEWLVFLLWNIWKNKTYIYQNMDFDKHQAYMVINGYVDTFCGKHIGVDFSNIDQKLILCGYKIFEMNEVDQNLFNRITVDHIIFGIVMYRSILCSEIECNEEFFTSRGFKLIFSSNINLIKNRVYILEYNNLTLQIYTIKNSNCLKFNISIHDKPFVNCDVKFIIDNSVLTYKS